MTVARDPGDADDLASPHREADAFHPGDARGISDDQIVDLEHRLAWLRVRFLDPEQHLAADHELGQLLRRGLGGGAVRDHLALAHDRDVVGRGHDLAQLVGDQHHRPALITEIVQNSEQMVRFLGGEDPGRLVENQDTGATKQGFEDLDPLLQADRQIGDAGIEVDLEPVVALERADLGACLLGPGPECENHPPPRAANSPAP